MDISKELARTYFIHGTILVGKTLLMAPITTRFRFKNKTYPSEEDLTIQEGSKVDYTNAEVERARNAHRNDLENILPFLVIGGFYLTTDPDLKTTRMLFRIFTVARILHTLAYLNGVAQPTRFLSFLTGMGVNVFMVVSVASKYISYV